MAQCQKTKVSLLEATVFPGLQYFVCMLLHDKRLVQLLLQCSRIHLRADFYFLFIFLPVWAILKLVFAIYFAY